MLNQIRKFTQTEEYQFYEYGEDYYKSRNTEIMSRDPKVFVEGVGVVSNPFKANHKLASGYLQKIVDQKVNYLLGNGAVLTDESLNLDAYGRDFDEFLQDLGTTASKKGKAWVYMYVDGNKLKMVEVAPEQIIPIYDRYGKLNQVIRHYDDVIEGKTVNIVLLYTSEGFFEYTKDGRKLKKAGEYGHYSSKAKLPNGETQSQEEHSFGRVPFIELRNNPEGLSDLYSIKSLIDIYDIVNSDFANNIDDMQDAYFVIKNFQGDNYDEFLHQLKQSKAIKVGDDGDVTTNQLQIPTEARSVFLELTDRNIFKFAMGVDTTQLSGGSLTNVAIKAQFADLDLKADKFEGEIRKFVRELIDFIGKYEGKDYDDEVTFSRSMVVNEMEMVEAVNNSAMTISKRTQLDVHPLVDDVEEELRRLEEEGEKALESFGFE